MKRFKTLRLRFALWTVGLLLAALGLFGLFVYETMARGLTAAVDETLRLTAVELSAEIELQNGEPAFNEDPTEDPQYTRLREQNFSLRLWDLSGRLVQEFGPYHELPPAQLDLSNPNPSAELTTIIDRSSQDQIHIYASPAVKLDRVVGTLQVALNLNTVSRTLDLLLITLLLGGPLIAIVAGAGGYFLVARALAPIDKITRTARDISANDLSARLNLPATDDEVGRLAATFDSMLDRLDDGFRRERQFTGDASHELRTPLAAIQTIIASTLARRRAPAEYEQALIDLNQEAEHMRALTEGLLQLAHQEAAGQSAKFERVDLSTLLKDVVDSLRPLAEDKGLKIVDRVPEDDLILMGDSDSLIRLFVNLLDNAVKYTAQGSITIAGQARDEQWLEVIISDTGIGIAPEHLPHIFDRFYQVDESRSKDGMGLGLAIVRSIAHAHGGTVAVDSTVGTGSTFVVQLPTR